MQIVYEDNHILAVNKPAGLLTQPSGTEQLSLEQLCKQYLKEKYQKQANVFLEAVHRLDKPASGIVVFARTSKGLSRLQASIREKKWSKKYLTLVQNQPPAEEGVLAHFSSHGKGGARGQKSKIALPLFAQRIIECATRDYVRNGSLSSDSGPIGIYRLSNCGR
jgi:23S rRNA-/tRNA-specific pseudouridylate synthase